MYTRVKSYIKQFERDDHRIEMQRKTDIKAIAEAMKQHSIEFYQCIFICTHNSRRSIFGQVWATVLADYYAVALNAFSGGTEVTTVNNNALLALADLGFEVQEPQNADNPKVEVRYGSSSVVHCFSKVFDDDPNPHRDFFAMMMCDHAAEHCPIIPNALERFNLTYPDPKRFDGTAQQNQEYKRVALTIGQELSYLFRCFQV
ncbi:low molecular weight phosphatase family protein [Mesohalobacter halotolerans]|uniref:Protein-tyrosine-phosphatase n=1 Tax=Mesohalobacter halotolerans TaxID=1883405 RepID=A0A4U5TRM9_9FLAO|nr:hypothetical protein [Mesohalobacter halotolerans]MBS3738743.1 hypothetical protein [Psychroflexus sp.]TKS56766.1 hypothetical protein FCN74_06995 [Mesohalobacter halotolerans]